MTFTLFTRPGCMKSEIIRCILNEKSVDHRLLDVTVSPGLETAEKVFGAQLTPAIADKDAILSDFDVMIEYIDERYPHPPLLPQGPHNRATVRVFYKSLVSDLYPMLSKYLDTSSMDAKEALRSQIDLLSGIIHSKSFLLSDEIGVADCTLMPVLHRVVNEDIALPNPMSRYYQRLMEREAFSAIFR
ncbi:glutathione S-transferase N-terminal domain-containing protein (plasmid) [Halopseudomonas sp. SMJS2]|uniref:glutathione S-transferase family protein n=1 Tax=Halopseudomonas sp. SMJS2 TaxID=3041098 RepID=UPI002452A276|nr:glutathione S-transferase N-terminal domain-containing protein [Halopseudomonas sp. SMJS2]WGK63459.1 glutathione S-transferase N-terminal domain-containing protein [Halopseudomonas sp. SMJS2]